MYQGITACVRQAAARGCAGRSRRGRRGRPGGREQRDQASCEGAGGAVTHARGVGEMPSRLKLLCPGGEGSTSHLTHTLWPREAAGTTGGCRGQCVRAARAVRQRGGTADGCAERGEPCRRAALYRAQIRCALRFGWGGGLQLWLLTRGNRALACQTQEWRVAARLTVKVTHSGSSRARRHQHPRPLIAWRRAPRKETE